MLLVLKGQNFYNPRLTPSVSTQLFSWFWDDFLQGGFDIGDFIEIAVDLFEEIENSQQHEQA